MTNNQFISVELQPGMDPDVPDDVVTKIKHAVGYDDSLPASEQTDKLEEVQELTDHIAGLIDHAKNIDDPGEHKVLTLDLSNMVSVPTPGSPERTQLGDRKPIKTIQLEPHFDEDEMYFDLPDGARATITRDEIDSLSAQAGCVPGISFEEQAPEVQAKHERLLQELIGAALAKASGSPELPVMGAIFDRPHAGRNTPEKVRLGDPCPCGSGEQYGKCHGKGKGAGAHDSAKKEIIILDTDKKRVTDKQRAGALNALAIRYHNLGRYKEAQRAGERASEIYQRLAAQNPDDFEPCLAGTFYNLSLSYKSTRPGRGRHCRQESGQ